MKGRHTRHLNRSTFVCSPTLVSSFFNETACRRWGGGAYNILDDYKEPLQHVHADGNRGTLGTTLENFASASLASLFCFFPFWLCTRQRQKRRQRAIRADEPRASGTHKVHDPTWCRIAVLLLYGDSTTRKIATKFAVMHGGGSPGDIIPRPLFFKWLFSVDILSRISFLRLTPPIINRLSQIIGAGTSNSNWLPYRRWYGID